jgi:hypothetical protein
MDTRRVLAQRTRSRTRMPPQPADLAVAANALFNSAFAEVALRGPSFGRTKVSDHPIERLDAFFIVRIVFARRKDAPIVAQSIQNDLRNNVIIERFDQGLDLLGSHQTS